jgi:hypothetical protein
VDVRPEVLREACLARVAVVMQRDHGVLYDLSHRARFCGELGEGWAEELLSLRPQMFESLSGVRWWKRRGPTSSGQDEWFSLVPR